MTLEEKIKQYDARANAKNYIAVAVNKEEFQELVKLLRELKAYRENRNGCAFCQYEHKSGTDYPCVTCKHNHVDNFRLRGDAE